MTHVSTLSNPFFSGGGLPLPKEGPSLVSELRILVSLILGSSIQSKIENSQQEGQVENRHFLTKEHQVIDIDL